MSGYLILQELHKHFHRKARFNGKLFQISSYKVLDDELPAKLVWKLLGYPS